ncbi:two pore domain potassium channel family protein [Maribius pontilimi]|uniref:Two pore domain potassium channel family protein n=1 Tax=Palleronia pontilimi TaxID=1964209 RepID=A0A934IFH3_9RHOB|nr:ion channel [Palleronia pontilimi]MBJ3761645.1 two pore domain potassium channel family protein [Palleronia pontilimi]
MIVQLAIGTGLILWTVLLGAILLWFADGFVMRRMRWLRKPQTPAAGLALFTISVLWTIALMTFAVWSWGVSFRTLGIFPDLESAIFFSLVAFTTLGLSDLALPYEWRLLGGFAAANGFLLFGLTAAILVDALRVARGGLNRPDD